jgi:hypothetical protein
MKPDNIKKRYFFWLGLQLTVPNTFHQAKMDGRECCNDNDNERAFE